MKEVSCSRGFGLITDPETGIEYNVQRNHSVDVPEEVAERLKAEYSGVSVTEIHTEPEDTAEICGTEMTDGSVCERPADECPYH